VDFHALRATYISHLVSSGASVKTCQLLARHSRPSMIIGIYAKASLHYIQGAVESLLAPHVILALEAVTDTGPGGDSLSTATQHATSTIAYGIQALSLTGARHRGAQDLGSFAETRPGSSPGSRTGPNDTVRPRPKPASSADEASSSYDGLICPSPQNPNDPSSILPSTATQNAPRHYAVAAQDLATIIDACIKLPRGDRGRRHGHDSRREALRLLGQFRPRFRPSPG
jgi:hypothetical protein